jgi:hypothetical protein
MMQTIICGLTIAGINELAKNFNGDETWEYGPDEADREKSLVFQRPNDNYPQGRDKVLGLLDWCRNNRRRFRIKARKTFPFWTWYYEAI